MLIDLWFRKFGDYVQRIGREGRVEEVDGRCCSVHPELCPRPSSLSSPY